MLEKPDLPDEYLIARLQDIYALRVARLTFLPLGADVNTAVYRVAAADGTGYFLKLRKGVFDEVTLKIPHFLRARGIAAIIAPLETVAGQQWARVGAHTMVLYPFVEGKNGFEVALSDRQWVAFGAALRKIHSILLPPDLAVLVPHEDFSPHWREAVKTFQAQVEETTFDEPVAARLAAFMRARRGEIDHIVCRAGRLGRELQSRKLDTVLCHADIHAGNLLLGENDELYIVDWDNPILAPRERDLMFIGAGIAGTWNTVRDEELFYRGYGQVTPDPVALAYYRYERIVEDIAEFCAQLLLSTGGGQDREQSYQYFTGLFLPGREIEIAVKTDNLSQL